jgi:hypothetical protein
MNVVGSSVKYSWAPRRYRCKTHAVTRLWRKRHIVVTGKPQPPICCLYPLPCPQPLVPILSLTATPLSSVPNPRAFILYPIHPHLHHRTPAPLSIPRPQPPPLSRFPDLQPPVPLSSIPTPAAPTRDRCCPMLQSSPLMHAYIFHDTLSQFILFLQGPSRKYILPYMR